MTNLTSKKAANHDPARWQQLFLEKLAETGHVTDSCTFASVSRETAYRHRREDEAFKAAWEEALDTAVGTLEDEAWRRAKDGVDEPVFYQGEECGTVRKYSDTLLIFLLKAHRPKLYRERVDVTTDGKPLTPQIYLPAVHDEEAK